MKKTIKTLAFIFADAIALTIAWFVAVILAGDNVATFISNEWWLFLIALFVCIGVNAVFKLYAELLRYISFSDMLKVCIANVFACVYFIIVSILAKTLSIEWGFITCFIYGTLVCLVRLAYRMVRTLRFSIKKYHDIKSGKRVIIVGAGSGGAMLLQDIFSSDKININPVCVLDDDKTKVGNVFHGVKIVGGTDDVVRFAKEFKADEIFVAMPSVKGKALKTVLEKCLKTGLPTKTIPGIYQIAEGSLSVSKLKDVEVNDLLGRDPININLEEIMGYIENRVVLVTGGGGSIGSELCRQIASHKPKQLIIVDIYENNAYEIQQELIRKYKDDLNLLVLIASVRDSKKIDTIFEKYKPEIVFHAAAHKHVPLMETSPNEAVKNNVSGTFKVADAAGRNGVKRFILISTDKAVNPTNIMGATKRVCEMIVQAMNNKYKTDFVAVRFGNVLGSNGSVIPLFKKQIAEGGPVTVTHKDMVRYFMTIPEAVSLVIQAGAYAKGGEIFVLDMGEPVKIYDLAEKMITLSGLKPGEDIEIKVTGLRPGEKLYEERLMEEEGLMRTPNNLISIGKPIEFDEKALFKKIQELYVEAYNETDKMKWLVHELVPTYVVDEKNS